MKPLIFTLPFWASIPAYGYMQLFGRTNRLEIQGQDFPGLLKEKKGPYLFAFWHSRLLLPLYYFRGLDIAVLVSRSRDGEFITQAMKRFGLQVCRGSASRNGAEGLMGLLRCLRRGATVAVTPDGPRGPREEVQPGVLYLAQRSGIPITPLSFSSSRNLRLNSWDRFVVPFPFGIVSMVVGETIAVDRREVGDRFEQKRIQLQEELRRITRLADESGL